MWVYVDHGVNLLSTENKKARWTPAITVWGLNLIPPNKAILKLGVVFCFFTNFTFVEPQ